MSDGPAVETREANSFPYKAFPTRHDREDRLPSRGESERSLRYPEVEKLIRELLECELPYCELPYCGPHGRPTMIQISNAELEKKFGRKV